MIEYEPIAGTTISNAVENMVKIANETSEVVGAKFNGTPMVALPGDDPRSIVDYYQSEVHRRHEEYVNSPEYKKQLREAQEAQKRHDVMLKAALADAPDKMTLINVDVWEKAVAANTDDYGSGVIRYAEKWARLIEGRIAKGDTIGAGAEETSHLADDEGITGYMYGCAVNILSKVWIRGDELRRWHNLKVQIRGEGEKANKSGTVLNPALITLGVSG